MVGKRLLSVCKQLLRLRRKDVLLLTYLSVLLVKLLFLQSRRPLPVLMAMFDAEPERSSRLRTQPQRLFRLVDGLLRLTLRDEYCMKRSLLSFHFLRKWGYPAEVRFGVTKREGTLKGHAWIELGGTPIAERTDPNTIYACTFAYPTPLPARTLPTTPALGKIIPA